MVEITHVVSAPLKKIRTNPKLGGWIELSERHPGRQRRYTKKHEWVSVDGEIGTVGITVFAQEALGDIVYAELPDIGTELAAGDIAAAVESVKAASDVYSPISITEALGDIVYAELPDIGTELAAGDTAAAVESVKAASDVYSPISGTVTEKNTQVEANPSLINKSTYEHGCMCALCVRTVWVCALFGCAHCVCAACVRVHNVGLHTVCVRVHNVWTVCVCTFLFVHTMCARVRSVCAQMFVCAGAHFCLCMVCMHEHRVCEPFVFANHSRVHMCVHGNCTRNHNFDLRACAHARLCVCAVLCTMSACAQHVRVGTVCLKVDQSG
uniref:Glycine cleavage system H protein, mitochondrial n=1 Tax=Ascaris lumbricoides TaxID=6252 RepID=A0A0M3IL59_ASCLU